MEYRAPREGMAGDWFGKPGALGKTGAGDTHRHRSREPTLHISYDLCKGVVITIALSCWEILTRNKFTPPPARGNPGTPVNSTAQCRRVAVTASTSDCMSNAYMSYRALTTRVLLPILTPPPPGCNAGVTGTRDDVRLILQPIGLYTRRTPRTSRPCSVILTSPLTRVGEDGTFQNPWPRTVLGRPTAAAPAAGAPAREP